MMAEAHEPGGSNTIGSTAELHRTTTPNERRKSNWGFTITMLVALAGIALLAWALM